MTISVLQEWLKRVLFSFRLLVVPGLIFQSTMIGGGYATGRELIEFFLRLGPVGALTAMAVATIIISVVCALAFEYARRFMLFDYHSFFKHLLGQSWVLFEISFLLLIVLVLSVLGAASSELLSKTLSIPPFWGALSLMALIAGFVFWGGRAIESFLSLWSILLYLTYIALVVWVWLNFGSNIENSFEQSEGIDWYHSVKSGISFSGYNLVVFTAVLFVVPRFKTSKESITAGLLCGPLAMTPGLLLLIAMTAFFPFILHEPIPSRFLIEQGVSSVFSYLFQFVIFGTFVETGVAFLHSINERVSALFASRNKKMPRALRPAISIVALCAAIFLAENIGLVTLISEGYGYSAILFLVIVVLPLFTKGILEIIRANKMPSSDT